MLLYNRSMICKDCKKYQKETTYMNIRQSFEVDCEEEFHGKVWFCARCGLCEKFNNNTNENLAAIRELNIRKII